MPFVPRPLADRLWEKVVIGGPDDCWPRPTGKNTGGRYGTICHENKTLSVHRVVYELEIGPIPEGLQIDHTCFNKLCCNPAHLEAVTPKENTRRARARKTHCPHGHPLDGIKSPGWRYCKTCHRLDTRRRVAQRAA